MNTMKKHGGARAGAGRPPNEAAKLTVASTSDPLIFLKAVMGNDDADIRLRVAAAQALLPYIHSKKVEGVKDQKQDAAQAAGGGRFATSKPPIRLVP